MIRLLQHPAALILLCFALIGTPVSYRGGASDAHPHMFLEFLLDASGGSFAHHHGDHPEDADHDDADGHHHTHDATSSTEQPAQRTGETADRFAPSVSAFVVGDVGQLAWVLPQHELSLTGEFATAFQPFSGTIAGLTHAPTSPPPR